VSHHTSPDKGAGPGLAPPGADWSNQAVSSDYRLATPLLVRLMGVALVLAGLLVLAVLVLGAALGWPTTVLSVAVVVVVLGVVAGAVVLRRLAPVVRLDDLGYEVRWIRGAGVRRGRWKDVEDVVATRVADDRCIVLRRRDGSLTTVPVDILSASTEQFVDDVRAHLNRGHGYRPVRWEG
jgi:hypothetical protein